MNVSDNFLNKYTNEVRETLFTNFTRITSNKGMKISKDLDSLSFSIYSKIYPVNNENGENLNTALATAKKQARGTDEFKVCEFLALSYINSYYGLSNLNALTDQKEPNHFGFAGAVESFSTQLELMGMCASSKKRSENSALQRLLSISRTSVTPEDYFNKTLESGKHYYEVDVELVCKLFGRVNKIKIDENYGAVYEKKFLSSATNILNQIEEAYRQLLYPAFGVTPYVGVVTFDKTAPVVTLADNACYEAVQPTEEFTNYYLPVMNHVMTDVITPATGLNGKRYSTRQFDFGVMYEAYDSNPNVTVYFPHKILEFAMLADCHVGTQAYAYQRCRNGEDKSAKAYCAYLREYFKDNLREYVIYCCKKFLMKYCEPDEEIEELADSSHDLNAQFLEEIKQRANYYGRCVTTACILTQLEVDVKKGDFVDLTDIMQFRFKVSAPTISVTNREFCAGIAKMKYGDVTAMKGVPQTQKEKSQLVGMVLQDFGYTFDVQKVNARPQYAYKVLEKLKEQGNTVDFANILMGKYDDGSICMSGQGEKIYLQDALTTWVFAGSRSGKGVMSYNLFSTALASGVPILYMDRKPDTSCVLRALAKRQGGDMFVVNGGQREFSKFDFDNAFKPYVSANIPEYLKGYMTEEQAYDLAYFRGILLTFSLASFMDAYKTDNSVTSTPAYQKLQSLMKGKTLMVVLDEFTNWANVFGGKLTTIGDSSFFGKNALSKSGIKVTYSALIEGVLSAEKAYQNELKKSPEKRSDSAIQLAEDNAEKAVATLKQDEIKTLLAGLYFRQLGLDYSRICASISTFVNASGIYSKSFKYFVIGQQLPLQYLPATKSNEYGFTDGNGNKAWNVTRDEKTGNPRFPLLNMLTQGSQAFIIGYNKDCRTYLNQDNSDCVASDWLTEARRGWGYHKSASGDIYDLFNNVKDSSKKTSWVNKEWTFFKPFLILNNAEEPPEELRVWNAEIANNPIKVEEMRKAREAAITGQFVAQSLHVANLGGMSWDDLVRDNDDGTGHLRNEIGFEGYCSMMGSEKLYDTLTLSGKIMDVYVKEVLKYPNGWEKFVYDLSPEALFSHEYAKDCLLYGREHAIRKHLIDSFTNEGFMSECIEVGNNKYSFATMLEKHLGSLFSLYPIPGDSETKLEGNAVDDSSIFDYTEESVVNTENNELNADTSGELNTTEEDTDFDDTLFEEDTPTTEEQSESEADVWYEDEVDEDAEQTAEPQPMTEESVTADTVNVAEMEEYFTQRAKVLYPMIAQTNESVKRIGEDNFVRIFVTRMMQEVNK